MADTEQLTDADVDAVLSSGAGIAAMRDCLDDLQFEEDTWLDKEGQEEWRGNLTGDQMRAWIRRHYSWDRSSAERNFIRDYELEVPTVGQRENAIAKAKGAKAGSTNQPKSTNPYSDNKAKGKLREIWERAWEEAAEEAGA